MNEKSMPSCTSSACGLHQTSPGSDSQQEIGWMEGLIEILGIYKRIEADTLKSVVKTTNILRQVLGIKQTFLLFISKKRSNDTDRQLSGSKRGRQTSVPNLQDCD